MRVSVSVRAITALKIAIRFLKTDSVTYYSSGILICNVLYFLLLETNKVRIWKGFVLCAGNPTVRGLCLK